MMKYGLLILVVIALGFFSCKAKETKNVEEKQSTEVKVKENKDYLSKGFKKGIIIINEKSDTCKYLIKLHETNEVLEPFKELSKDYINDKLVVYIKFNRQRRMSRCENTTPVEILEIKK